MKQSSFFLLRVSFLLAFAAVSVVISTLTFYVSEALLSLDNKEISATPRERVTVVIDAGHGGRDGGASSDDGLLEKELNLYVAKKVAALLSLAEVDVVMTRESDVLLAADDSPHKKLDDLNARLRIGSESDNSIFVSIHMNKFPVKKYSGLQVYYSKNNENSKLLAENIREKSISLIDADNTRQTKAATSAIYILHHIKNPAVLIECGFLSNDKEAALLATEEYRDKLAAMITLSILDYLSPETT